MKRHAYALNKHTWREGTYRCPCGAWRHLAGPTHPEHPGQWLYSLDGEHWSVEDVEHVPVADKEKP